MPLSTDHWPRSLWSGVVVLSATLLSVNESCTAEPENYHHISILANHPIPSGIEHFYSDFHIMKDIRQCPRPLVLPLSTSSLTPQLKNPV